MSTTDKNSENESVLTSIDINLDVKSLLYLLGSEEIIKKKKLTRTDNTLLKMPRCDD